MRDETGAARFPLDPEAWVRPPTFHTARRTTNVQIDVQQRYPLVKKRRRRGSTAGNTEHTHTGDWTESRSHRRRDPLEGQRKRHFAENHEPISLQSPQINMPRRGHGALCDFHPHRALSTSSFNAQHFTRAKVRAGRRLSATPVRLPVCSTRRSSARRGNTSK